MRRFITTHDQGSKIKDERGRTGGMYVRREKSTGCWLRETWRNESTLIEASEINTKMNIIEVGWKSVEWRYQAEDRHKWRAVVDTVMKLRAA